MNISNWGLIVAVLVWGLFYAGPRVYTLMVQYAVMKAQLDAAEKRAKMPSVADAMGAAGTPAEFNFDGPYA